MRYIKQYESYNRENVEVFNKLKSILELYFNNISYDDIEDFKLEIKGNGYYYFEFKLKYDSFAYQETFYIKIKNKEDFEIEIDNSEYNDGIKKIFNPLLKICNYTSNKKNKFMNRKSYRFNYINQDSIIKLIDELTIITDDLILKNNAKNYNI